MVSPGNYARSSISRSSLHLLIASNISANPHYHSLHESRPCETRMHTQVIVPQQFEMRQSRTVNSSLIIAASSFLHRIIRSPSQSDAPFLEELERIGGGRDGLIAFLFEFATHFENRERFNTHRVTRSQTRRNTIRNLIRQYSIRRTPVPGRAFRSLPRVQVTSRLLEQQETCPVCRDPFQLNVKVSPLRCNHFFHEDCIATWLRMNSTCPMCREEAGVRHY